MSYLTQSALAGDKSVQSRVAACAATEGISQPESWAWEKRWELSAQPGWVPAYASAVAGGSSDPGTDEAAITDGMILSAVQSLLSRQDDPAPDAAPHLTDPA